MINFMIRTFAGLLLLLVASSAFSHQQKTAISTVLFNPRTGNIEVMHRFNLHDAEHAVRHIFGKNADIIDSAKTQQQFSDYVSERFTMAKEDGQSIALKTAGFEVDGKFFWVYQETKQPAKLDNLVISHNALRDLWPSQINTINVEGKGDIKTLTFRDSIELLKIEFEHH
tara:strand:+ start:21775 stop:22284 length:510 start_codon:yes stop_codon:yes gene_type:complete